MRRGGSWRGFTVWAPDPPSQQGWAAINLRRGANQSYRSTSSPLTQSYTSEPAPAPNPTPTRFFRGLSLSPESTTTKNIDRPADPEDEIEKPACTLNTHTYTYRTQEHTPHTKYLLHRTYAPAPARGMNRQGPSCWPIASTCLSSLYVVGSCELLMLCACQCVYVCGCGCGCDLVSLTDSTRHHFIPPHISTSERRI